METEDSNLEELSFVEVELLNENPKDTLDDFRYRFYKHLQRATWLRYAGLLLVLFGIGAMLWFICIPEALEHENSWRFFHSAQFFFLLCWGTMTSLILIYFIISNASGKQSYQDLLDRAERLTYDMSPPEPAQTTTATHPSTDSSHG